MQNIADLVKRKVKEAYGTELDDDRLKEYLDYYKSKVNFSARAVKDAVTPSPEYLERYKSFKGMGDAIKSNLNQLIPSNEAFEQARKGDFTALTKASMGAALNAPMLGVLKGVPNTEFSKAHKIAQKHAALPVEQGGLGLPPNNTAIDRAKALGFDTEAYHGTNADIKEFDPTLSSQGAAKGPGVYVTELPEDASRWAGNNVDSNVMPLLLNKSNVLPLSELSSNNAERLSNFLGRELNEGDSWPGFSLENRGSLSTSAKNAGFSGADHAGPSASRYIKDTVITEPSIIRSRFAAFDPFKKDSANILASILAGTTLASQMDNKKRKNR